MFPLYDQFKIPGKKPHLTLILIIVNVVLFIWSFPHLEEFIFRFGLIPTRIFQGRALFTLFSSMFFHGGIGHLFGNMWFLWVFGDNLERRLGKAKFLGFYILCGLLSALIYLILAPEKSIPAIGASGAISGVLGGYLILFPRHRIVSLVPIFFFIELIAIPAVIFIGIWFLYQLFYIGSQTMIAYWAHIGGFLAGVFLIKFFTKPQRFYYSPY